MNSEKTITDKTTTEVNMQASNIDEKGNVLFLDEERLARKNVGFPPFKNHKNGLGIYNFIKTRLLAMNDKRWPMALKLYHFFIRFSIWMKKGGMKAYLYKKMIMLHPDREAHTSTIIMPLNVDADEKMPPCGDGSKVMELDLDVTDKGEKVVLPIDFIKESLKKMKYISGMKTCLCREANDCEDYPVDVACLFMGEPAKTVVKNGLAVPLTYEEACARVDLAAKHGLVGQAVWIEVEQMLWGVRNDEMDQFLEICFCCPCCCIAMRLARNATSKERHRFQPAGWTAVADRTSCTGCGLCIKGEHGCPVEAIKLGEDGKVVIDQESCVGCGICKTRCPADVIKIKQTMPMRGDIKEYFKESYNIELDI